MVGAVLAVEVERDDVAVVRDLPDRGFQVGQSGLGEREDEQHPGVVAVVGQRHVEQAGELRPVDADGAQVVVQRPAAEDADGDRDVLEALHGHRPQPVGGDGDVGKLLDERFHPAQDQRGFTADQRRLVDAVVTQLPGERLDLVDVGQFLDRRVEAALEVPAALAADVARVGQVDLARADGTAEPAQAVQPVGQVRPLRQQGGRALLGLPAGEGAFADRDRCCHGEVLLVLGIVGTRCCVRPVRGTPGASRPTREPSAPGS